MKIKNLKFKINKILLLGSGALKIGQAGEFDYSGSQAIKALKEEGIKVVLVNPNIATIQTSEGFADQVYFLPIEPHFIEEIIKREKPQGLLLSFGGQTALNCGLALAKSGILKKHRVQVLGTPISAIETTEDRHLFASTLHQIGLLAAESLAVQNTKTAATAAQKIGYPVIIRGAFSLGGQDSAICSNEKELKEAADRALSKVPQILIEEYLHGWKEIEYEVVRDRFDNCITVCNMENVDPMGIHTGESIVVAPSQTLNNFEYHGLRQISIQLVRHLGIVGECNVQFALNPKPKTVNLDYKIIEVNARLSRSSALASKATGYPLAYVAAKLALGYSLVDLKNAVTQKTIACFEPALDYLVVKIPRWDLSKFQKSQTLIGPFMQSVGEVMAIGRKFEEALQKAIRMLSIGMEGVLDEKAPHTSFAQPTTWRIFAVAQAIKRGVTIKKIAAATGIDPFFLSKIKNIVEFEKEISQISAAGGSRRRAPASAQLDITPPTTLQFQTRVSTDGKETTDRTRREMIKCAKQLGFSDKRLAIILSTTEEKIRALRQKLNIHPATKQIDTLAAEYPAQTNYLYLTYNGDQDDVSNKDIRATNQKHDGASLKIATNVNKTLGAGGGLSEAEISKRIKKETSRAFFDGGENALKVIVLGSGPYRIGSSVEFDWCSVTCAQTAAALGLEPIVINCNPETVSTDYDMADRLYFEELTTETVLEIYQKENPLGLIVSMGGQTPNNLVMDLASAGAHILGTTPESIDNAEDRHKFGNLCDRLGIAQPPWASFKSAKEAVAFAQKIGYPVLVRPSYVLSGSAMNVAFNSGDLAQYLALASQVSTKYPVVISKFIENSKEVEIDAVANNGQILASQITEHIENAGVHSGDATVVLPPQKINRQTETKINAAAANIAQALKITGPFNIQFLAKDNKVLVIECNLRASRSFPFVSKATGINLAKLATEAILGKLSTVNCSPRSRLAESKRVTGEAGQLSTVNYVAIKSPQFSFSRIKGADPVLRVEMASTGEVATFGRDVHEALLKSLIATGTALPKKSVFISLAGDENKTEFLSSSKTLAKLGLVIFATAGTSKFLKIHGITNTKLHKIHENKKPNVLNFLNTKKIDLVINIFDPYFKKEFDDDYLIRRTTIDFGIPLLTNLKLAELFVEALDRKKLADLKALPWSSYVHSLSS